MNYMTTFEAWFGVVIVMLVGVVARFTRLFRPTYIRYMNKFIFHICIPVMAFKSIAAVKIRELDWKIVGCFLVIRVVFALLVAIPTYFTKGNIGDYVTHYIASTWLNTIIFGKPVIQNLFPKLVPLCVSASISSYFFQLPFMLVCYEIDRKFNKHIRTDDEIEAKSAIKKNDEGEAEKGVQMKEETKDEEAENDSKEIFSPKPVVVEKESILSIIIGVLINLCKVTPLYGVVIGVIYSAIGWDIPAWLDSPLTLLGNCVAGSTAFVVGVHLVGLYKFWRIAFVRTLVYSAVKLIIYPLVSCVFILAFNFKGDLAVASVVLSMMPIAFPSYVLAKRYKAHPNVVSITLALTYLLSLPFIILWVEIAQAMF